MPGFGAARDSRTLARVRMCGPPLVTERILEALPQVPGSRWKSFADHRDVREDVRDVAGDRWRLKIRPVGLPFLYSRAWWR
jgi:hypothetical protein